jgi:hypothetical protein
MDFACQGRAICPADKKVADENTLLQVRKTRDFEKLASGMPYFASSFFKR